ncbi:MAG: outer membrane lipid asymmetry maintenance protein MlaD [Alphaproteobacteria bacterium]|nr:outer membrane lipid asymmetry maintenance protein MlaD [Alphaproteobacteria bacterium]
MNKRLETIVGMAVVLLGAILLSYVYVHKSDKANKIQDGYYEITASFRKTDGLEIGSDVRLAGIKIGTVSNQTLDKRYSATVTMLIQEGIELTTDSSAAIQTDGLFGSKHIELEPGGDDEIIPAGGAITYIQDAMVVEELLERIIEMAKAKDAEKKSAKDNES